MTFTDPRPGVLNVAVEIHEKFFSTSTNPQSKYIYPKQGLSETTQNVFTIGRNCTNPI